MARVRKGFHRVSGPGSFGWKRLMIVGFTGRNGAGAITVTSTPSLEVGDTIYSVSRQSGAANEDASFENQVTVAGQLQQSSASNLSANNYFAFVQRKG